jgi:hypothetical protein
LKIPCQKNPHSMRFSISVHKYLFFEWNMYFKNSTFLQIICFVSKQLRFYGMSISSLLLRVQDIRSLRVCSRSEYLSRKQDVPSKMHSVIFYYIFMWANWQLYAAVQWERCIHAPEEELELVSCYLPKKAGFGEQGFDFHFCENQNLPKNIQFTLKNQQLLLSCPTILWEKSHYYGEPTKRLVR